MHASNWQVLWCEKLTFFPSIFWLRVIHQFISSVRCKIALITVAVIEWSPHIAGCDCCNWWIICTGYGTVKGPQRWIWRRQRPSWCFGETDGGDVSCEGHREVLSVMGSTISPLSFWSKVLKSQLTYRDVTFCQSLVGWVTLILSFAMDNNPHIYCRTWLIPGEGEYNCNVPYKDKYNVQLYNNVNNAHL